MSKKSLFVVCSHPLVIAQHLIELTDYISDGFEISFVTNLTYLHDFPSLAPLLVKYKFFHIPIQRKPSFTDFSSILGILSLLFKHRPNFLLSFTPKGGLLSAISSLLYSTFICELFYIHYFTGVLWQSLPFLSFKKFFLYFADLIIISSAKFVYCDSLSQKNLFISSYPFFRDKPRVLGQGSLKGVDLNRFFPDKKVGLEFRQNMNIPQDAIIILFVGRLCTDKNITLLVTSFLDLLPQYPHAILLLVGPIEDQTLLPFFNQSQMNILHLDFTHDLNPIYNAADLLCLPSSREGFGSVILEAAACKCPSIGSFIPGLVDSIVHLQTGLLFPLSFKPSLLQSFQFLLSNPSFRQYLADTAYQRVVNEFSQDRVLSHFYSDFTDSLLE